MTEDLINCYQDCEKLMPFLHLPIQSGSNKILKSMNRKHDKKYYLSVIDKLKSINKEIKFSSDFIIGYPGETVKDFQDTIDLVEKVGFLNSYSFIFSPRPGTPATKKKLNNLEESKQRLKKLQSILENFQLKNNKILIQQNCEVLIENKLKNQEKYFGRTKFMTPVIFESKNCQYGELVNIKITSFNHNNLFGFHMINKSEQAA
jgi:tRNA-2-methylthio-N6-dimethylallyladenosine synthase